MKKIGIETILTQKSLANFINYYTEKASNTELNMKFWSKKLKYYLKKVIYFIYNFKQSLLQHILNIYIFK